DVLVALQAGRGLDRLVVRDDDAGDDRDRRRSRGRAEQVDAAGLEGAHDRLLKLGGDLPALAHDPYDGTGDPRSETSEGQDALAAGRDEDALRSCRFDRAGLR